jgi:hypothetical protein
VGLKENIMATRNDVTGDLIKSRVNSKEFEDNFDNIFRKKPTVKKDDDWDEKRVDIIGQNGNIGYGENEDG